MKILITAILLFSITNINPDLIIHMKDKKPNTNSNSSFKATVSASKDLPKGLYGTWNVNSLVISTNNPFLSKEKNSDIWVLEKNKDIITLSNPNTGATSSITVKDVKDNTAVFTREKITDKYREHEKVKITIDGNEFFGTDNLTIEHLRKGRILFKDVVEYNVRGQKISGVTIKDIFTEDEE